MKNHKAIQCILFLSALILMVSPARAAFVTVTTLMDENDGGSGGTGMSLRDAITAASAGDTIRFTVTGTITLNNAYGQLSINKNLTIQGPGAHLLTVSGNNQMRVFNITSGTVVISDLRIINGFVTATGGGYARGGGIYVSGGSLTLRRGVVANCVANHGDASAYSNGAGISGRGAGVSITIEYCEISGNYCQDPFGYSEIGGGIYLESASATITGSTIANNSAEFGAGVYACVDSTVTINGCTIVNNISGADGGGVFSDAFFGGSPLVTIRNSIVYGNTDGNPTGDIGYFPNLCEDPSGDVNDIILDGFNVIGALGNYTWDGKASDLSNTDPLANSLADNGGPTRTCSLNAGSPAINRIPSAGSYNGAPTSDQRGWGRTGNYDVGAYEYAAPEPEINLQGNSQDIASGDNTPSSDDHTDFGSVPIAGSTLTRTFTIQNTGGGSLAICDVWLDGTGAGAFTISDPPAATIDGSSSDTVAVQFDPSATGLHQATLHVSNNDSNEDHYTFAIQGTGINAFPVNFQTDGTPGATLTGETSQIVNYGANCTAVTANAAVGYTFVNWTGTGGFTSTTNPVTVTNVTQGMTITANYAINQYTISFQTDGTPGATLSGNTSQTVNHSANCTAVTANAAVGYTFVNWTGTGGFTSTANPVTVTNVTQNMTVTANYAISQYTVSFQTDGTPGATLSGNTSQTVNHGTNCSAVTANATVGYTFVNWTGTGGFTSTDNPVAVTNVTQGMTITANYDAAIPSSERQALIALYNSTEGDSWTDNSGWKAPPLDSDGFAMPGTEGTWHGITVADGHVTEIGMSSNNMIGPLPAEIGNLVSLTILGLQTDGLTGGIPAEIGNLTNLTVLRLNQNHLSGPIPAAIGNLTKLTGLYLHQNDLDGAIPPEIGSLTNLTTLNLRINMLKGGIPAEIGSLTKLVDLYLDCNGLVGEIPIGLTNLTSLAHLGIRYNALYASDADLIVFLNSQDPNWATCQTVAPENVTATPVNSTSISLTWDPITYTSDPGEFRIFVSTTPGAGYTFYDRTYSKSVTSLPVTGLNPSTPYYFAIQTRTDPHGSGTYEQKNTVDSENSDEATATTIPAHTVTFQTDGTPGATLSGNTSQTVNHGTNCSAVTANAAVGYAFVNWTGTGGFTSTANPVTVTNVTQNMSVSANFAINQYTVSFQTDGTPGATLTGTTSQTINYGGNCTAVTANNPVGYHFVNWTGTDDFVSTDNPLTVTNVKTDKTFTANYAINQYTVSFQTDGTAGATLTGTASQTVNHGANCSAVTANIPTGYHFVNWTGTGGFTATNNPVTVTNVTQDMTVTANYAINQYTVSFQTDGTAGATLTGTTSQTVDHGNDCSAVMANAPSGYHLDEWTGTAGFTSTANPVIVTSITGDMTVTANFALDQFTISGMVRLDGAGLANVTMDGLPGNPATNAAGFYSASVDNGWSGTVTPERSGYDFTPASTVYTNVTSDRTTNYAAASVATLTLASPNGNERWTPGTRRTITWTQTYLTGSITIQLRRGDGSAVTLGTAPAAVGAFNWTVPAAQPSGHDYTVRVYKGALADKSDRWFSIDRAPADFDNNGFSDILWRYSATSGLDRLWRIGGGDSGIAAIPDESGTQAAEFSENESSGELEAVSEQEMMGDRLVVAPNPLAAAAVNLESEESTGTASGNAKGALELISSVNLPARQSVDWQMAGTGDFNHDGQPDILWRNAATGANDIWLMNGSVVISSAALPMLANAKWRIAGTGDFNHDGETDILWRFYGAGGFNSVWLMNGSTKVSTVNLPALIDLDWQIAGCGDFNRDHQADIVWRREAGGGENAVWLMNGTALILTRELPAQPNLTWKLVGVGDFNEDENADLIWRHEAAGGANRVWLMDGAKLLAQENLPAEPDLSWKIGN